MRILLSSTVNFLLSFPIYLSILPLCSSHSCWFTFERAFRWRPNPPSTGWHASVFPGDLLITVPGSSRIFSQNKRNVWSSRLSQNKINPSLSITEVTNIFLPTQLTVCSRIFLPVDIYFLRVCFFFICCYTLSFALKYNDNATFIFNRCASSIDVSLNHFQVNSPRICDPSVLPMRLIPHRLLSCYLQMVRVLGQH